MNATLCACPKLCRDYAETMPRLCRACLVCFAATFQVFVRTGGGSTARHIRCGEADGHCVLSVHYVLHTSCNSKPDPLCTYRSDKAQIPRQAPICPTVHRTMRLIVGHCDAPAFALIVQCEPKNLLSLRLLWLIGRFIPFGPPSYQP